MKAKKLIRSNPHLPVKNLRQTLDFYREKPGYYDEWVFGDKDGGIQRDEIPGQRYNGFLILQPNEIYFCGNISLSL
jgi:hypothetical protein